MMQRQVTVAEQSLKETQIALKRSRNAERLAADIALKWLSDSENPLEPTYRFLNVGGRVRNVTVRIDFPDWVASTTPSDRWEANQEGEIHFRSTGGHVVNLPDPAVFAIIYQNTFGEVVTKQFVLGTGSPYPREKVTTYAVEDC